MDLYALKAYHQPGDPLDRYPNGRDLASNYPPFFRFVEQFNADCSVCQLIWSAVRNGSPAPVRAVQLRARAPDRSGYLENMEDKAKGLFHSILSRLGRRDYYPVSSLWVVSWCYPGEDIDGSELYSPRGELRIFARPESPPSLRKHISGRSICPPDSEHNVGRIQKWLEDCLESHERCGTGVSGALFDDRKGQSILPSRVVDVGLGSRSQVRLVTTKGERGQFCALSYCWRPKLLSDSQNTLLTTTIDQFRQNLPIKDLPKPIQDAIEITRRIGVPYLWVDRLCIVQNDAQDVKTECNRMCDIYERALLTLAAMGDDNGEMGLFLNREVLDHPISGTSKVGGQLPWRVRLPCTIKDKYLGDVYLGRVLYTEPEFLGRHQGCFDQELYRSRWATRGWVLQERFLSRRIVYFGKRQLYWECQKNFQNEDGSLDSSEDMLYSFVGLEKRTIKRTSSHELLLEEFSRIGNSNLSLYDVDILEHWGKLVEHYSGLNLTVDADKLRAISGIAEALRRRFALKNFHFGLWMDYLCQQLMWYVESTVKAPASWAAWDGKVKYCFRMPQETTFLSSFEVIYINSETIPALSLKGKVIPIQSRRVSDDRIEEFEDWLGFVTTLFAGGSPPWLMGGKNASRFGEIPDFEAFITIHDKLAGVIHYDNKLDAANGSACLLVSSVESCRYEGLPYYYYDMLILEKVNIAKSGNAFRRIGIAQAVWVPEASIGFEIHQQPKIEILIV